MANKSVFGSAQKVSKAPTADAVNRAGGKAYAMGEKAALAQYAATGTFNDSFYAKAEDQVAEVLALLPKVDVPFIAKVAIYAHEKGRMKDMPALLAAHLSTRGVEGLTHLKQIFPLVIHNGKMLRNFMQIIFSGATGRKGTGTALKKLGKSWFANKSPETIFKMSTGNDPTLADIIKVCHVPDLGSPERKAFYAYLLDKEHDFDSLPPLVKDYEKFKKDPAAWKGELPKVPFEMVMGLPLSDKQWKLLATSSTWTQVRMNLNTFARHGVFKTSAEVKAVADIIRNPEAIERVKPFPYQIFTTYLNTSEAGDESVPAPIRNALHDALELSTKNVPIVPGQTYIAVDTSGSMSSAITGSRAGATSKTTCIQVAALVASTFLRQNKDTQIIPFDTRVHAANNIVPHDSIMTNAAKLAQYGGGGTDCASVLRHLNQKKAKGDLVIYVSDNESWFSGEGANRYRYYEGTDMATEWLEYKKRNPKAKLVCIDLEMGSTVQVQSDTSVLNVGGFSDSIWEVIKSFVEGMPTADHWVSIIEAVNLPAQA